MKVNLADMAKKVLFEEIDKPTKEEENKWESKGRNGKLYYVIRGEDNKVTEFVDSQRVDEYNKMVGKKYKPKQVAENLFENIGIEEETEDSEEVEGSNEAEESSETGREVANEETESKEAKLEDEVTASSEFIENETNTQEDNDMTENDDTSADEESDDSKPQQKNDELLQENKEEVDGNKTETSGQGN